MSRFIILGVALAMLATGTIVAFKLTHRPAIAAQALDPAILHAALQKLQTDGALP